MYSALAVSNALLACAKKETESISHLQMQKLLYFAQGWSLAIRGRALFEDRIEAGRYGPIVPIAFDAFEKFGLGPITEPASSPSYWSQPGGNVPPISDKEDLQFVLEVWSTYKKFSALELASISLRAGGPWSILKEEHQEELRAEGPVISQQWLKDAFSQELETSKKSGRAV